MQDQVEHDPSYFDDDDADDTSVVEHEFMSDEDVLKIAQREVELSDSYAISELSSDREKAMNYYFGRPRGDETEGNSEQQSMDVADMVEATLAEIMPLFSHHRIAKFTADNGGDVDQAQIESNYCNYVFMEENEGYTTLYTSIKDALLQKNGIVEIYVDEHVQVEYDDYSNLTVFDLAALLETEKGIKKVVSKYEENEDGTNDITLKTMRKIKKLVVEPVEPENFLFAISHRSTNAKTIRFCGRRIITSKSDLIAQGHDDEQVMALAPYDGSTSDESYSRNQTNSENEFQTSSDETELVEVFRCYVKMDYDKDGIAELHQVIYSGDQLLDITFAKFVPFASGSPFLMSHRFLGMSLFDKLKGVQDQKTAFIRQYINNSMQMNNRRLEVLDGQVNMEDVLNSRAGGAIRAKVKGAVTSIPVDDIGPSCIMALDYLDKVRSERGGASLDMQTSEINIGANVGSQGVERQYTSKEKMAALMTRTLAETLIKQIYVIIHATLRESFDEEYPVQVNSEWKATRPTTWMKRETVKIDIGMSAGERDKKVGVLSNVLDLQIKAMEMDAEDILTNRKKIHNTVTDILDAAGVDNPERYWIDPDSPQAQSALKSKQESQAAAGEEEKAMQTKIFEYQKSIEDSKDQVSVLREENKKLLQKDKDIQELFKHNDEMRYKYTELELKYEKDIPGEGVE